MGLMDNAKTWVINWLDLDNQTPRTKELKKLEEYYDGKHEDQLKVKHNRFDDNLTVNLCGLIADKAVSALVGDPSEGHGLSWTFPSELDGTKDKSIEWLDTVWDQNNQEILLHKNALSGAKFGYPAFKIVPDGEGRFRLINIKTKLLTVETNPQDEDEVIKYIITYKVKDDDKETIYREVTAPERSGWSIETRKQEGRKQWELVAPPVFWDYDFPPILAWQNLPNNESPYGRSDIENIIDIQDRYNFLISNISKIIRLYAHPNRYGKNMTDQIIEQIMNLGPEEMPLLKGDADIVYLENKADLGSSMQFMQALRELTFSIAREVDVSLFKDKVGQITNMGLRMMYKDTLEKLGTKRMLYGNAYQELNRRLLVLGGYEEERCTINWPSPLPENEVEEIAALKTDLELGLVSKQTASKKRDYVWKDEQARLDEEKLAGDNAGATLLENFFRNA